MNTQVMGLNQGSWDGLAHVPGNEEWVLMGKLLATGERGDLFPSLHHITACCRSSLCVNSLQQAFIAESNISVDFNNSFIVLGTKGRECTGNIIHLMGQYHPKHMPSNEILKQDEIKPQS